MDDCPAIITYKEWLGKNRRLIYMEYPTKYLIELAYAAYRVNKGYEKQTRDRKSVV